MPDAIEWVEVYNGGDMAWTAATDGDIFYDDTAPDAGKADLISDVASIAAGEAVILFNIEPADTTGSFTLAEAETLFATDFPSYTGQFGWFDGSGMSSGGSDGASLFLSATDADGDGVWDDPMDSDFLGLLQYEEAAGDSHPAGQTYSATGWGTPTPGVVVPEPSSAAIVLLGVLSLFGMRRRSR